MASTPVNATPKRFENGGVIKLVDGSDDYPILNVEAGTIEIVDPIREAVEYTDRGVQQQPLEGDDVQGSIRVSVKNGAFTGAASLRGLLATAGSTGLVKEYGIIIDIADYRGASTGQRITVTNAYMDRSSPQSMRTGGPGALDMREFTLKVRGTFTYATY